MAFTKYLVALGLSFDIVGALFLALDLLGRSRLEVIESMFRHFLKTATTPWRWFRHLTRWSDTRPYDVQSSEAALYHISELLHALTTAALGICTYMLLEKTGALQIKWPDNWAEAILNKRLLAFFLVLGFGYAGRKLWHMPVLRLIKNPRALASVAYLTALILAILFLPDAVIVAILFYISMVLSALTLYLLTLPARWCFLLKENTGIESALRASGLVFLLIGFALQLVGALL